jgi:putative endonuclease
MYRFLLLSLLPMPQDPLIVYALARSAQRRALRNRRRHLAKRPRVKLRKKPQLSLPQRSGAYHEELALRLLVSHGLTPLARNLRCRAGEIDLAMREGATLIFVEVRARRHSNYGGAAASIDRRKQTRLARAAAILLPSLTYQFWAGLIPKARFDVVAFEASGPTWIKNAFWLDESPLSTGAAKPLLRP